MTGMTVLTSNTYTCIYTLSIQISMCMLGVIPPTSSPLSPIGPEKPLSPFTPYKTKPHVILERRALPPNRHVGPQLACSTTYKQYPLKPVVCTIRASACLKSLRSCTSITACLALSVTHDMGTDVG